MVMPVRSGLWSWSSLKPYKSEQRDFHCSFSVLISRVTTQGNPVPKITEKGTLPKHLTSSQLVGAAGLEPTTCWL
jgi:hypothetical protein